MIKDSRCLVVLDYDRKIVIEEWGIILLSGIGDVPRQSAALKRIGVSAIEDAWMRSHNAPKPVGE